MGYKLIWEIQIKMAFLYHEGGNDAGLCRRIWWYLPKLWAQLPFDLEIPYLGFFPTVTSAHIVSESVQDYLLWQGLDGTQIKHGIFTKLILCSCEKKKTKMSAFSVPMYRGVQAVQLSRESNVQSSIQCGLHFCVIKWGGWEQYVLSLSVSICKKKYWKDK